jgi:hypothetical protein
VELRFAIHGWSAWAPGLSTPAAWQDWAEHPGLPCGDELPACAEMASMQRRRLSRLGRAAVQVAWQCQGDDAGLPTVFVSRYGDVQRSLAAIETLEVSGDMSPTLFASSVHNAIGAMYSIARQLQGNLVCLAAESDGVAAAMVEVAGLLADGADRVLIVCADEPLPPRWSELDPRPAATYAYALRVGAAEAGRPTLRLKLGDSNRVKSQLGSGLASPAAVDAGPGLPDDLRVLALLLRNAASSLTQISGRRRWQWTRDD